MTKTSLSRAFGYQQCWAAENPIESLLIRWP